MKRILCYGDSNTYGANPAWVPDWDNDPKKTVRLPKEDRWTGILSELLLVSPPVLREPIQNSPFYGMYDDKSVALSKALAGLYEELSRKYSCYFLDAAQFARASDLDCLHMDPENHRRLARAISEKIKEIFTET